MKVAFFGTTLLEHGGGLEKYFIETSVALSKNFNIEIDIVTMDEDFSFKILQLLSIYNLKKYDRSALRKISSENILAQLCNVNYYKCKNILEARNILKNYDLIYSKNELLEGFVLKFLIGYKDLPKIIFGCHTSLFYSGIQNLKSKFRNFLYSSFVYKYLAGGVIAFHVLNSSDEIVAKNIFPNKDVFKIFNPFDFELFYRNQKKYENTYEFESIKAKKILWIGNFHQVKGIETLGLLIEGLSDIKEKVVWLIAGGGQDLNLVQAFVEENDNVQYIGYIPSNNIADLMSKIDLVVNTSKSESFGFTTLEANAMGKPMFSLVTSGHKDLIKNNLNGVIFQNRELYEQGIKDFIEGKIKFDSIKIKEYIKNKVDSEIIYKQIYNMFNIVFNKK